MEKTNMYCLKCRKRTNTKNPQVVKLKPAKNQLTLTGRCAVCNTKKFKFLNNQEGPGLLSMLGIKTPFAKIHIIGSILG